jgi:hypothetical protein
MSGFTLERGVSVHWRHNYLELLSIMSLLGLVLT